MNATFDGDVVRLGGDGRQRFYDSRGYGFPDDGELVLAPVEAAHLLSRGDLDAIDSMAFREFLVETGVARSFVVYRDLRDRGFYLSPDRAGWCESPGGSDLVVYPRGKGPWDGRVEYRVQVAGERESLAAEGISGRVLAVVDEDGELTYFEVSRREPNGASTYDPPAGLDARLIDDRVLVWDPPAELYERGFFGQRLLGRNAETGPLQLSLLEAAYLARRDCFDLSETVVSDRGRAIEKRRFDRRLRTYTALREAGTVPKSGFKFGADFRVYEEFSTVSDLSHSASLVRALRTDHTFAPRDLALDVRLAGSVRKRMCFALVGSETTEDGDIEWLSVARLTP